jgi:hypothetical protein
MIDMKNIFKILTLLLVVTLWTGCDKDFVEINTNPIQPTSMDPAFLFTNVELGSTYSGSSISYPATIVQQHQSPFLGVLASGNMNQNNDGTASDTWNRYFGIVKNLVDIIDKTKDDPARSNLYNMALIWKAFVFQILTDTYGDIPYTEAGMGYLDANFFPKYDTQESIYMDLLTTLETAIAALDPTGKIEKTDLFYAGDIAKWKKLGNSIMLRVAMRLSQANPAKAQEYAAKAFNGGVFQSIADNCVMKHTASIAYPLYGYFTGSEQANYYLNKTFVDFLKNTSDPRLQVISVVYSNPSLAWNDPNQVADDTPANQIGMPIGYDDQTLKNEPNFPGKAGSGFKYSQVKRNVLVKQDATCVLISHAQTQLLLAEARHKGWITSGTAEGYYKEGIKAHMAQLGTIDPLAVVPAATIDAFVTAATLTAGSEMQLIGEQYWVACFLNGHEAWSNWRRTGYPVLSPNPYPVNDIDSDFIYRLTYPAAESNVNVEKVEEAIARQWGGDKTNNKLDHKVWWDK